MVFSAGIKGFELKLNWFTGLLETRVKLYKEILLLRNKQETYLLHKNLEIEPHQNSSLLASVKH
jgi:hypothetical protein